VEKEEVGEGRWMVRLGTYRDVYLYNAMESKCGYSNSTFLYSLLYW
jgi:hypothetical protein